MRYGVMRYRMGDMVEIDDPGSPFHGLIGEVVYTDREALRVDIAPKWYWGEGDVKKAGYETAVSLQAYPMGTIVEQENGDLWVRISDESWATQLVVGYGAVHALPSYMLASRNVKRTFLGDLPDRR